MREENFSPEQSLLLIQSMIDKTKMNLGANRVYFLFWGWLTFGLVIIQWFLKVILDYPSHYLVWILTIPAFILTMIYGSRQTQRAGVRTYISDSMRYLWTGIGISFFVLSFIITRQDGGWFTAWPFFILFYGLGTFISGSILQYRPLQIGGIANWLLAIAATFVSFDNQLLLAAFAILVSYIIPGHLFPSKK